MTNNISPIPHHRKSRVLGPDLNPDQGPMDLGRDSSPDGPWSGVDSGPTMDLGNALARGQPWPGDAGNALTRGQPGTMDSGNPLTGDQTMDLGDAAPRYQPGPMPRVAGPMRFSYRMAKRPDADGAMWLWKDFRADEHRYRTKALGKKFGIVAACVFPNGYAYIFRILSPVMPVAHMRDYERAGRKGGSRAIERALHAFGAGNCKITVLWVGPESEYRAVECVLITLFKDRGLAPYNKAPGTLKAPTKRKPTATPEQVPTPTPTATPEQVPTPEPRHAHFTDTFYQNAGLGLWTDPEFPALYIHVEPGRWRHLRKFKYRFQCPVSGTVHMGNLGFPWENITVVRAGVMLWNIRKEKKAEAERQKFEDAHPLPKRRAPPTPQARANMSLAQKLAAQRRRRARAMVNQDQGVRQ